MAGVPLNGDSLSIPVSIRARVLQVFIKGLMNLKDDFVLASVAFLDSVHPWKVVRVLLQKDT